MRFLISTGGELLPEFAGVLTTPGHLGIPKAMRDGKPWVADNQAFRNGFKPEVFFPWLDERLQFRPTCLFVTCPDAVGDYLETRRLWRVWSSRFTGWPLAFVGQDGETDIPKDAQCLFVGGTTRWKLGEDAADLIGLALRRGLHIHIGRVNWGRRYRHFQRMVGSENFTCDGTRIRFDGRERTERAWIGYQAQKPLLRLD